MTQPSNNAALSYNPGAAEASETHTSRLIVRLELADAGGTNNDPTKVAYWDSLSGGAMSRTVTARKQPGKVKPKKIPGLHLMLAALTLTRAWNTKKEHREPLGPIIKSWVNSDGPLEGLRVKVTQMLLQDDGQYKDIDYYVGPISGYEGPKGNSDGDDLAKETLTIDPDDYDTLD